LVAKEGKILDKFHTNPISPTLHEQENFGLEMPLQKRNQTTSTEIDLIEVVKLMLPSPDQVIELKEAVMTKHRSLLDQLSPEQRTDFESRMAEMLGEMLTALPTSEEKSEIVKKLPNPSFLDEFSKLQTATAAQMAAYEGNPSILARFLGVSEAKVAKSLSKSRDDLIFAADDEMESILGQELGLENWQMTYQDFLDDLESISEWPHLVFARPLTAVEWRWCKSEKNQKYVPQIAPPLWLNWLKQ
jgi:hypothetical protein